MILSTSASKAVSVAGEATHVLVAYTPSEDVMSTFRNLAAVKPVSSSPSPFVACVTFDDVGAVCSVSVVDELAPAVLSAVHAHVASMPRQRTCVSMRGLSTLDENKRDLFALSST